MDKHHFDDSGMLDLTFSNIYRYLLEEDLNQIQIDSVQAAIQALSGLESSMDDLPEVFLKKIISNLDKINSYYRTDKYDFKVVILENLSKKDKKKPSTFDYFKILLEYLGNFLRRALQLNTKKRLSQFKEYTNEFNYPQVFLSYAHDDKAYTLGLYYLFLKHGIFLHIDWMHNGIIDDAHLLKQTLDENMSQSDQFLFLRTLNSELIGSSGMIRQWCSWELGVYYKYKNTEKFYTVLYKEKTDQKNALLKTLKPLNRIKSQRMV